MKKIFRLALISLALIIGLVVTCSLMVGKVFEEKLEFKIANKTNVPISVYIRVTDLDLNITDEREVSELQDIPPDDIKNASMNIDGTAPEVCSAVIVKGGNSTKEYPCEERIKTGEGSALTKVDLTVQF